LAWLHVLAFSLQPLALPPPSMSPPPPAKKMKYPVDLCVSILYTFAMNVAYAVRPPRPRRGRSAKKRPGRSSDNRSLWSVVCGLWSADCGPWTVDCENGPASGKSRKIPENPGKSRKKIKNNPHPTIKPKEPPQPI